MIRFTHRRMSGAGTGHQHIESLHWVNPLTNQSNSSPVRPTLVDWVRTHANEAFVQDAVGRRQYVGVVDANPPYLRTYADGVWTDNLLALPTY